MIQEAFSQPSPPGESTDHHAHSLSHHLTTWLAVFALLAFGLALRLFDLTDQPIDFHPTRQLRGAIVARGLYYQMLPSADPQVRQQAVAYANSTGQYEPPILEFLVAGIYRLLGKEEIWVARIFSSLFWIIGGLALFDLARRGSSIGGALLALSYYLVLPFAIQASRSFQPDPGMVMWIVLSVYFLYRWSEQQAWKWALLAGLLGGIAVLVKIPAAYIVGAAAVAVVLYTLGLKRFWRSPQVWVMVALMVLPTLVFYLGKQGRATEYFSNWTISLSHLLLEAGFYGRWLNLVQSLVGLLALLASLVGVLIAQPRYRIFLVGLWAGYFVYGLFLPYQLYTHSYYHLQLVPLVALSLAPVAQVILERLAQQTAVWRIVFVGILLVGLLFPAWLYILDQSQQDYRSEPAYWQEIASYLPQDGKIIALTQDYGYRLMYYGWRKVGLWPNRGEQKLSLLRGSEKDFEPFFAKNTRDRSYFLITAFKQFEDQPDLKQYLANHYPLTAEGSGYLIYDLQNPLSTPSP